MRKPAGAILAALGTLAALATGAAGAAAQNIQGTLDVGSSRVSYSGSDDKSTAAMVAPGLVAQWPLVSVSAAASYSHFGDGLSSTQGAAAASLFTPERGRFRGELFASGGGSHHSEVGSTHQLIGTVRAHMRSGAGGVWIGGGGGTAGSADENRSLRVADAGAWAAWSGFLGSISIAPTVVEDSIRYTDFLLRGRWTGSRFEFGGSFGSRTGDNPPIFGSAVRSWGSIDAVAWVASHVGVVASVGRYPVDFLQGFPGGTFAALGLRVATASVPWPTFFPPVPESSPPSVAWTAPDTATLTGFTVSGDAYTLRRFDVGAPRAASSVELNGDFTAWRPVRMEPTGRGWWSTTMDVRPGIYQVMVRVDGGEWLAPPGMAVVRDEFGGTAAVLVLDPE